MTQALPSVSEAATAPVRLRTPNDSRFKYLCLTPIVGWYLVFFAVPFVFLIWIGFWRVENFQLVPDLSIENYAEIAGNFFSRSRYGLALVQSIWVATTTTIFAVAFCYAIALAIRFCVPANRQRLALLLVIAPFWSSYILRLYSWQTILSRNGLANSALDWAGLDALKLDIIYTQLATSVGLVHYLTPIVVVILYVTVVNIDQTLIEAARELGATRLQAFRRVILPLSRVGLITAASFALIVGLGDGLAGALLGGGAGASPIGKVPLFSSMLLADYASSTNLPRTSVLAAILVVVMILFMLAGFAMADRAQRRIAE